MGREKINIFLTVSSKIEKQKVIVKWATTLSNSNKLTEILTLSWTQHGKPVTEKYIKKQRH